jgi:hypothetical protein
MMLSRSNAEENGEPTIVGSEWFNEWQMEQ